MMTSCNRGCVNRELRSPTYMSHAISVMAVSFLINFVRESEKARLTDRAQ
jgi:hypothetical protein